MVKELERKLDRLQKKILARLDTIAAACEGGGPFQLSIAALRGLSLRLRQDVSTMKADVASEQKRNRRPCKREPRHSQNATVNPGSKRGSIRRRRHRLWDAFETGDTREVRRHR